MWNTRVEKKFDTLWKMCIGQQQKFVWRIFLNFANKRRSMTLLIYLSSRVIESPSKFSSVCDWAENCLKRHYPWPKLTQFSRLSRLPSLGAGLREKSENLQIWCVNLSFYSTLIRYRMSLPLKFQRKQPDCAVANGENRMQFYFLKVIGEAHVK